MDADGASSGLASRSPSLLSLRTGYPPFPMTDVRRCGAATKRGGACRRRVAAGHSQCHLHQPSQELSPSDLEAVVSRMRRWQDEIWGSSTRNFRALAKVSTDLTKWQDQILGIGRSRMLGTSMDQAGRPFSAGSFIGPGHTLTPDLDQILASGFQPLASEFEVNPAGILLASTDDPRVKPRTIMRNSHREG